MKYLYFYKCFWLFLSTLTLVACDSKPKSYEVSITNPLDFIRKNESIEIKLYQFSQENRKQLIIVDAQKNKVRTQYIDDYLLFQTDLQPNETKQFEIVLNDKENSYKTPSDTLSTFCRIVPERIDDFAWENDKVAFRTYGPKCQQMFENGISGGLISSGIDCWAKKVNYPIINKWYANHVKGISYHEDHGEGLDAYHVGTTRGCGGVALIHNGNPIYSKNFKSWKVLANGPIRSIFELTYAPIKIDNTSTVTEKKRITLDLDSNLYHCKVLYTSSKKLSAASIGLALHLNKGKRTSNIKEGWVSYWEPMSDSFIGTGIINDPKSIINVAVNDTLYKDESLNNIWVNTIIKENSFEYWAGFGWKKSGQFNTNQDWETYLKQEALKKVSPITLTITKN